MNSLTRESIRRRFIACGWYARLRHDDNSGDNGTDAFDDKNESGDTTAERPISLANNYKYKSNTQRQRNIQSKWGALVQKPATKRKKKTWKVCVQARRLCAKQTHADTHKRETTKKTQQKQADNKRKKKRTLVAIQKCNPIMRRRRKPMPKPRSTLPTSFP